MIWVWCDCDKVLKLLCREFGMTLTRVWNRKGFDTITGRVKERVYDCDKVWNDYVKGFIRFWSGFETLLEESWIEGFWQSFETIKEKEIQEKIKFRYLFANTMCLQYTAKQCAGQSSLNRHDTKNAILLQHDFKKKNEKCKICIVSQKNMKTETKTDKPKVQ